MSKWFSFPATDLQHTAVLLVNQFIGYLSFSIAEIIADGLHVFS